MNMHVVGATCESICGRRLEPRIGKFSTDQSDCDPELIRMAAKPENFTNAGFSFFNVPSGRVSKWAEVGCTQNRSSKDRGLTHPPVRDKQTSRVAPYHSHILLRQITGSTYRKVTILPIRDKASEADRPPIASHRARRL